MYQQICKITAEVEGDKVEVKVHIAHAHYYIVHKLLYVVRACRVNSIDDLYHIVLQQPARFSRMHSII